jgi:hypothetical protein
MLTAQYFNSQNRQKSKEHVTFLPWKWRPKAIIPETKVKGYLTPICEKKRE